MVSVEDLAKLSLRAIVAFAVRCARRVPSSYSPSHWVSKAIDDALSIAETFAKRKVPKSFGDRANRAAKEATEASKSVSEQLKTGAYSAASAATAAALASASAHYAARNQASDSEAFEGRSSAISSAQFAYEIAAKLDSQAAAAAHIDFEHLLSLKSGRPGTLGPFIDPSEQGPLGPLWPAGEPEWLRQPDGPKAPIQAVEPDAPPIMFYFDTVEFDDEEIACILGHLSNLYRSIGGDALVIERTETLDPASILEPEEV
jgi:hypothetical protein